MNHFDLKTIPAHSVTERDKNVFYRADAFKARIIELPPGGEIPPCDMQQHVIFTVVSGEAEITVDNQIASAGEGHCVIISPATVAMKSAQGVRIMAVQINAVDSPRQERDA